MNRRWPRVVITLMLTGCGPGIDNPHRDVPASESEAIAEEDGTGVDGTGAEGTGDLPTATNDAPSLDDGNQASTDDMVWIRHEDYGNRAQVPLQNPTTVAPPDIGEFETVAFESSNSTVATEILRDQERDPEASFSANNEYFDQFGRSFAVGDFDGDGRDDIAVGAPFETAENRKESGCTTTAPRKAKCHKIGAGVMYIWEGIGNGALLDDWMLRDQGGSGERQAGDRFAWAMVSADFNGDGYDDLAVSAPWESIAGSPHAGAVTLFMGQSSGLRTYATFNSSVFGTDFAPEKGDRFGWSLTTGHFNGDGYVDLAIAAPRRRSPFGSAREPRSGVVFLLAGGEFISTLSIIAHPEPTVGLGQGFDRFGYSLAAGDFTSDPGDEIAVGSFIDRVWGKQAGKVHIFRRNDFGVYEPQQSVHSGHWWGLPENDEYFGHALAAGDFDGDGREDLAIGAPGDMRDRGRVYVHMFPEGVALFPGPVLDASAGPWGGGHFNPGNRFGHALASGDLDGDGIAELAVGAPRTTIIGLFRIPRTGLAYVYRGSGQGLSAWGSVNRASSDTEIDDFGQALAIGDFNGDGDGELVVGAPDEVGVERSGVTVPFSGAAYVFEVAGSFLQSAVRLAQN